VYKFSFSDRPADWTSARLWLFYAVRDSTARLYPRNRNRVIAKDKTSFRSKTNVAHSLSAKKRVRQNEKRRLRNRHRKEIVKVAVKGFDTAIAAGDVVKATDALKKVVQKLDRTAAKRTIHKNAASRKRSRLAKRLNTLKAKASGKAA
jgi:small subunit ribosomal protein S20